MANDKHTEVKELAKSNGFELTDAQAEAIVSYFSAPKEQSRTKTFRFPGDLLDWLEAKASSTGRSPNAELIELLRNAKAAQTA